MRILSQESNDPNGAVELVVTLVDCGSEMNVSGNPRVRPEIDRFCEKYEVLDNGCWEWRAFVDKDGYGRFRSSVLGATSAHRVSYFLAGLNIPSGLVIDHLCRNRSCVNPDHLEPVTAVENTKRGNPGIFQKSKTHCKSGHEFTDENTGTLLSNGYVKRYCKKCATIRSIKYRERKKTHGPSAC